MGRVFDDIMDSLNELLDAAKGKETGIVKHKWNDDGFVLEYKGYKSRIVYSAEDGVLYGKIDGISDLVNFESNSSDTIECEFHKAVDDYLEFCKELGKQPDMPT